MPSDYEMMEDDQETSSAPDKSESSEEGYGDHVCTINKSIKPDAKVGDIIPVKVEKVYEDEFAVVPAGEKKEKPAETEPAETETETDMMEA